MCTYSEIDGQNHVLIHPDICPELTEPIEEIAHQKATAQQAAAQKVQSVDIVDDEESGTEDTSDEPSISIDMPRRRLTMRKGQKFFSYRELSGGGNF